MWLNNNGQLFSQQPSFYGCLEEAQPQTNGEIFMPAETRASEIVVAEEEANDEPGPVMHICPAVVKAMERSSHDLFFSLLRTGNAAVQSCPPLAIEWHGNAAPVLMKRTRDMAAADCATLNDAGTAAPLAGVVKMPHCDFWCPPRKRLAVDEDFSLAQCAAPEQNMAAQGAYLLPTGHKRSRESEAAIIEVPDTYCKRRLDMYGH